MQRANALIRGILIGVIQLASVLPGPGFTVRAASAESPGLNPGPSFADSIRTWQSRRRQSMVAPNGWLTVAGLYWLEPGENAFGTAAGVPVQLPAGSAPERAGVFILEDDAEDLVRITVRLAEGVDAKLNGEEVTGTRRLYTDASGRADVITIGRLSLSVIERNQGYAVRLRDPESPYRKHFAGLDFYAPDDRYRVVASYHPFDTPRKIAVPNFKGWTDSSEVPGELTFTLDGVECRLLPFIEDPKDSSLFIVFSDSTSGSETYGGGRFLVTTKPKAQEVVLDFNLAYNPPCAFTPYATCPLPPEGNDLPVAVRAGEKQYPGHE